MSQHPPSLPPSVRPRSVLVTIVGVFTLLEGIAGLLGALVIVLMAAGVGSLAGFAAKADPAFGQAAGNVAGMAMGMFLCVALVVFVIALIPLTGGLSVLYRQGRIRATCWAVLGILLSGLALLQVGSTNPLEVSLNTMYLIDGGWLAYALAKLIVLALAGKEFAQGTPISRSRSVSEWTPGEPERKSTVTETSVPGEPDRKSAAAGTYAPSAGTSKMLVAGLLLSMVLSGLALAGSFGYLGKLRGNFVYADRVARMKSAIEDGKGSLLLDILDKERATVHDRDEHGDTPLHWAVARGRTPIVRELLLRGADPTEKNVKGETPLALAEAAGFDAVAKILRDPDSVRQSRAEEIRLTDRSEYGRRIERLRTAIERGQVSEVEALLKEGANLHDRDAQGETALMWAVGKGNVPLCLMLLAKGSNPADRDDGGGTALMRAAAEGNVQILALLLTPEAEAKRTPDVFKLAGLEKPAWPALQAKDVDVIDRKGDSALTKAVRAGHLDAFKLLVPHSRKLVMGGGVPDGDSAGWFNNAAWRLATASDQKMRDGRLAVELAKQAVKAHKDSAQYMDTLAAAHAEAGEFADAVRWQEQALVLNNESGFADRLALYKKKMPYRAP